MERNVLSKPKLNHLNHMKPHLMRRNTFVNTFQNENVVFAQLRVGILPLEVEIGRYRNIPLENRLCLFRVNMPEDEKHFICICPTYIVYREIMYDKITLDSPNFTSLDDDENKFMYVMSCNDKCSMDFLDIAWSEIVALLYNQNEFWCKIMALLHVN